MSGHLYRCAKTYGPDLGLSAVFRQWRASSHCSRLHGYALGFRFVFAADRLDENGWVVDFGSLKPLRQWLQDTFDHKLLVAADDPYIDDFKHSFLVDVTDMLIVARTGCEAFARMAFETAQAVVLHNTGNRAYVVSCECYEHGANSATYYGESST